MYLVFDTETTGLPKNFNAPLSDSDNWPRMVQIAWQLHDEDGNLIENQDYQKITNSIIEILENKASISEQTCMQYAEKFAWYHLKSKFEKVIVSL